MLGVPTSKILDLLNGTPRASNTTLDQAEQFIVRFHKPASMATLKIIPHDAVKKAIAQENETLKEQRDYNTVYHTREETEAVLPQMQHYSPKEHPEEQSWILLGPWLDLIMASQGLMETDLHRIQLPGSFVVQLIYASQVGLHLGRVSAGDAEDLADAFPKKTVRGDSLKNLIQGKFFTRLDTCSLKDAIIGEGPIRSVRDLWMRLATSARGMTGIRDLRKHDSSMPLFMYLLPWKHGMKTDLEYRIYCAPPTGKIAAISQYKWHAPWYHAARTRSEQEGIIQRLHEGCKVLHQKIMAHPAMIEKLKSRGFVFDVTEDRGTQGVQLIELNGFGAMSGCGACLFHWIRDAPVIYGLSDTVEVRVAYGSFS